MRHRRATRLFDRTANQRKALFRGLLVSLIEHERIETTVAKAKEIKKMAEKMVTLGKRGSLHSRRLAFSYVPNKSFVKKLFDEIAPRFTDRNGGYTRIIKTRFRIKDSAPLAVIEFIDYEARNIKEPSKTEDKEKSSAAAPKKPAAQKKTAGGKKAAAAPSAKAKTKATAKPKVAEEGKSPEKKKAAPAKRKAAAKKSTSD